jgi:hypothetical protein
MSWWSCTELLAPAWQVTRAQVLSGLGTAAGGVTASMLPPGFAALGISTAPADRFKPLFIGLDYSAQRARRSAAAAGECRLNRAAGAALDACRCPPADCGGSVTCTSNSGASAGTDNNGVWIVQNTTGLCPKPTTSSGPTTTPKPIFTSSGASTFKEWSRAGCIWSVLASAVALLASMS